VGGKDETRGLHWRTVHAALTFAIIVVWGVQETAQGHSLDARGRGRSKEASVGVSVSGQRGYAYDVLP
jgi:hypothetical protein